MLTTGTETFTLRKGPRRCYADDIGAGPADTTWHLILDDKYGDGETSLWLTDARPEHDVHRWANRIITKLTQDTVHVTAWQRATSGDFEADYQVVAHVIELICPGWSPLIRTCAHGTEVENVMEMLQSGNGFIKHDGDSGNGFIEYEYNGDGRRNDTGAREYVAVRTVGRFAHLRTLTDRDRHPGCLDPA